MKVDLLSGYGPIRQFRHTSNAGVCDQITLQHCHVVRCTVVHLQRKFLPSWKQRLNPQLFAQTPPNRMNE